MPEKWQPSLLFGWRHAAAVIGFTCASGASAALAVPLGFASLNGGTTGGAAGPTVTATTAGQFQTFAEQAGPLTIRVEGNLDIGIVDVESDKTILGVGSTAGLVGNLRIDGVNNVIVRNLSISNPSSIGSDDSILVDESTNIWIDHNNIFDSTDGLLDIVNESDFVTVSWNKFYYSPDFAQNVNTSHRFAMLIGNDDDKIQDADNLRVTLHHNHWGAFVRERMPRVRYGDVHVFNEYFNSFANNYVIRSAIAAQVLIENNYFEDVFSPFVKQFKDNDDPPEQPEPLTEASGNLFVNSGGAMQAGDDVFDPPYAYTLIDAADVKDLVLAGAGVGIMTLAGDYNGDGRVDAGDYVRWRNHLGDPDESALGHNGDGGAVTLDDYVWWNQHYGTPGSGGIASIPVGVPEPTTMSLALLALAGALATSRRSEYAHLRNTR